MSRKTGTILNTRKLELFLSADGVVVDQYHKTTGKCYNDNITGQPLGCVLLYNHIKKRASNKRLTWNSYNRYMVFLKKNEGSLSPDVPIHKHHIQPKCYGGTNSRSNLVLCHRRQHVLAHLLLYLVTGSSDDFNAYWLISQQLRQYCGSYGDKYINRFRKRNRSKIRLPDDQLTQHQLAGRRSGLLNTVLQQKARKKVGSLLGKKYGQIVGISNQSDELKLKLSRKMLFKYEFQTITHRVIVPASITGDQVGEALIDFEKQNQLPTRFNPNCKNHINRLLRGLRRTVYHWSFLGNLG